MAQHELRLVKLKADKVNRSKQELVASMHQARMSGESYRDIAKVVGVVHSRVYTILNRG